MKSQKWITSTFYLVQPIGLGIIDSGVVEDTTYCKGVGSRVSKFWDVIETLVFICTLQYVNMLFSMFGYVY